METFVVAYSLVWLAVFLYVVRLDVRQRRMSRRLEELEARWEEPRASPQPQSRAA
jgi:CcmD family protein